MSVTIRYFKAGIEITAQEAAYDPKAYNTVEMIKAEENQGKKGKK